MPKQPARFTKTEIKRAVSGAISAATEAGLPEVRLRIGELELIMHLATSSTAAAEKVLAPTTALDEWLKHNADATEGH
jgi:hypothetical protein